MHTSNQTKTSLSGSDETEYANRQKIIKESRRELLDLLEVALSGSPSWPIVRAKVMEIFGRKGLQGAGQ